MTDFDPKSGTFRQPLYAPRWAWWAFAAFMAVVGLCGVATAPPPPAARPAPVVDQRNTADYRRQVEDVCEAAVRVQVAHPETLRFAYFTRSSRFGASGWTIWAPFQAGNEYGATGAYVGICTEDASGIVSANIVTP